MFIIYHSNKSEVFKKLIVDVVLQDPLSDPMQSEIIITNNRATNKWLQIELANYIGILMNFKFMTPNSFISDFAENTFFKKNCIDTLSYNVLYWGIIDICLNSCEKINDISIKKYLDNGNNQLKCSQFSEKLANLFKKYLIYRPEWLKSWQNCVEVKNLGDDQIWQAKIWRLFLRKYLKNNDYYQFSFIKDVNPLQNFISFFEKEKNISIDISKRIFIFGISFMPFLYWKFFYILSQHCDVYLWFTNLLHYHKNYLNKNNLYSLYNKKLFNKNIQSRKFFSKIYNKISNFKFNDFNNIDYNKQNIFSVDFFLNSWGLLEKKSLFFLSKLKDVYEVGSFILPTGDSLLKYLQEDIISSNYKKNFLFFKNCRTLKRGQKKILSLSDNSITFHICHNIQREIEILHENLLSMMEDDKELLPGDIIVVAPNVYDYFFAINNVFNNIHGRKLPFSISSCCKYTYQNTTISIVLRILSVNNSLFTSEEIFSFLSFPLIASRFDISKEDVKLLHQWTLETGIRWGLDEIVVHKLNIPFTEENTWCFGLAKMLLGYVMKSQHGFWKGIFPYDDSVGEFTKIIGKLGEFLKKLKNWRNRLNKSYKLTEWELCINDIINDFFLFPSHKYLEENKSLLFLNSLWIEIIESGLKSKFFHNIHVEVLYDKLKNKLSKNMKNNHFLPHVINFFNIVPTCFFSCKIVCFLGMNYNDFPRNQVFSNFDLTEKNNDFCDCDTYLEDCYSFLAMILLATERVYISFINSCNYNNNELNNSSILVEELFEYILNNFFLEDDNQLNNIKKFQKHFYRTYTAFAFSEKNFLSSNRKKNFSFEWFPEKNKFNKNLIGSFNFFSSSLSKLTNNVISLRDLCSFYSHPIRTWFQKRLGVYFKTYTPKFLNYESFSVDYLTRYKLNFQLINCLIKHESLENLYHRIYSSGVLPYGKFGRLFWVQQHEKIKNLADTIKSYNIFQKSKINFSLKFDDIEINDQIDLNLDYGLVDWKPTKLSVKDGFLLWIKHLICCSIGKKNDSRLFGIESQWHFHSLSVRQAREYLFSLVLDYYYGMQTPLYLLHKSSEAWVKYIFNCKKQKNFFSDDFYQKEAYKRLVQAWKGTENFPGEFYDPYLQRLISFDLCEKDIFKIINNAKKYLLPVIENNVEK